MLVLVHAFRCFTRRAKRHLLILRVVATVKAELADIENQIRVHYRERA